MPETFATIDGKSLTVPILNTLASGKKLRLRIPATSLRQISKTHAILLTEVKKGPIYGVNTGFGPLANRVLPPQSLIELQYNLIRSHASGAGEPLPPEFVRAAMLVRLNTLSRGNSAISAALAKHYAACIEASIIPVVYEHGAVGTSGDLVQLAHIALGLIGEGKVYNGHRHSHIPASVALKRAKLTPHRLRPKEGLAMINGTAMMTGVAALVTQHTQQLLEYAVRNGALALELVHAYGDSINPRLHELRPHPGQKLVANKLRSLVEGSLLLRDRTELVFSEDVRNVQELPEAIQQVYSLRCIAQILGPLAETLEHTTAVLNREMNSVTDNPVYDERGKRFLHGGNFHGDYVAVAMDQLKIPLVKMIMLSERRINFFLNENVNKSFPPFLNLQQPGLTLALQGLQFVATSTTAQAQTFAFPHTVHSIPTNGDNQDLVSMGTDAALLAHKVVENAYIVMAIEMITLAQAVDCAKNVRKLSPSGKKHYAFIRKFVQVVQQDRPLQPAVEALVAALKQGKGN